MNQAMTYPLGLFSDRLCDQHPKISIGRVAVPGLHVDLSLNRKCCPKNAHLEPYGGGRCKIPHKSLLGNQVKGVCDKRPRHDYRDRDLAIQTEQTVLCNYYYTYKNRRWYSLVFHKVKTIHPRREIRIIGLLVTKI